MIYIDPKTPIHNLRNLGPKSESQLAEIEVFDYASLQAKGAIDCFIELSQLENFKPSLNFLYAMFGAIENKHWTEYAKDKGRFQLELQELNDIKKLFK